MMIDRNKNTSMTGHVYIYMHAYRTESLGGIHIEKKSFFRRVIHPLFLFRIIYIYIYIYRSFLVVCLDVPFEHTRDSRIGSQHVRVWPYMTFGS